MRVSFKGHCPLMKSLLLLLTCLSFEYTAHTQDGKIIADLKKVLHDTSAFFATYKGVPKYYEPDGVSDTVFHSTFTIDGTYDNSINFPFGEGWYHAEIKDSMQKKEAFALFEKWKVLIGQMLGQQYKTWEFKKEFVKGWPSIEFVFRTGSLRIRIVCHNLRFMIRDRDNIYNLYVSMKYSTI